MSVASFKRTKTKSELTELGPMMTVFGGALLFRNEFSEFLEHPCPGKEGPGRRAAQEKGDRLGGGGWHLL